MAKMKIDYAGDLAVKLSRLGKESIEIGKKTVIAGAAPVADKIRANLEASLSNSEYSTGDLLDSLGIAPPLVDKNGDINTKIGFDGYDRKGTPNAIKARAMESGTSKQKKKPFIRPAVKATEEKAIQEMEKVLNEEISKII